MKKIVIDDPKVRQNLELFRKVSLRAQSTHTPVKSFSALVDRATGEMRQHEIGEQWDKKKWRIIEVRIGEGAQSVSFQVSDIEPLALKVMHATVQVLNAAIAHLKNLGPIDVFEGIAHLSLPQTDEEIIQQAWHPGSRIEAEQELFRQPIGTYLFRQDEFTKILEEQLRASLLTDVHCYTLAWTLAKEQIAEMTLVNKSGKWCQYNDNPALQEVCFLSLADLLKTKSREQGMPLVPLQ